MSKTIIIGAGPAGLASAYHCKIQNKKFEVYEASRKVGGNCITINEKGFYFDSGAHRLHDVDKKTTELFKNLLKEDLKKINIPSQIYFRGKFIDFPLSPLNLMKAIGFKKLFFEGIKIIINNTYKSKDQNNFKSFAKSKYGSFLSNELLINYSEKLWGLNSEKLSTKISGKRLKGLDIKTLIIEFLFGKKEKTKHLDGSFFYPKYGIGTLFDELANYIDFKNIFLNNKITKIIHKDFKIDLIEINKNKTIKADQIISTIPLDFFIKQMSPKPPDKIKNILNSIIYRNIILVAIFLDKKSVNKNGSMYFPSKDFHFTRIYEPRNRSSKMSPKNKTSLVVEIPCFSKDDIWKNNSKAVEQNTIKKIIEIGLIKERDIIGTKTYKIANAYPVLENKFEDKIKEINSYLSKFTNLKNIGRNALFEYSHIHDQFINSRKIFFEKK